MRLVIVVQKSLANSIAMIKYEFNPDLEILEVQYEDIITVDDLIDYGNKICNDAGLPRKLKILTDVTRGQYSIDVDDMPLAIKALKKHIQHFEFIKAAFIQNKPRETAFSMLLETDTDFKNYVHRIFAERKIALQWLLDG